MRIDEVLAQENAGGEVLWAIADHQGSVRLLMDNQGNVVNNITYDSFGNVTVETNAGNSFRFTYTGRELDPETGNYYYRSRFLDPLTGGFIQEDKIGFEGGDTNLSRYVNNSPLIYTDPYGENLYSILNNADKFSAGFADTVTLGGSTWLRNKLYGDLATRNHQGALFNAGRISGAVTTAALGLSKLKNLSKISKLDEIGDGAKDATKAGSIFPEKDPISVINEAVNPNIVQQYNNRACGVACAETLLRQIGVDNVNQQQIADAVGDFFVNADELERGLNSFSPPGIQWKQ